MNIILITCNPYTFINIRFFALSDGYTLSIFRSFDFGLESSHTFENQIKSVSFDMSSSAEIVWVLDSRGNILNWNMETDTVYVTLLQTV